MRVSEIAASSGCSLAEGDYVKLTMDIGAPGGWNTGQIVRIYGLVREPYPPGLVVPVSRRPPLGDHNTVYFFQRRAPVSWTESMLSDSSGAGDGTGLVEHASLLVLDGDRLCGVDADRALGPGDTVYLSQDTQFAPSALGTGPRTLPRTRVYNAPRGTRCTVRSRRSLATGADLSPSTTASSTESVDGVGYVLETDVTATDTEWETYSGSKNWEWFAPLSQEELRAVEDATAGARGCEVSWDVVG
ncbi:uncharacterized protein BXZ73DRAFT_98064 [Epithele typhae]|uniref:uncharacterized protein n=1 Tax=Epithele typhae TaxID=378194 RepID=UPI0020084130|nr:uncharacterized protein BXZ73DRAFT_98064 [Epithele typhae]KAH9941676.1 hypothetical protein BXZ73DRAFT_98064 [Epithele typhae]